MAEKKERTTDQLKNMRQQQVSKHKLDLEKKRTHQSKILLNTNKRLQKQEEQTPKRDMKVIDTKKIDQLLQDIQKNKKELKIKLTEVEASITGDKPVKDLADLVKRKKALEKENKIYIKKENKLKQKKVKKIEKAKKIEQKKELKKQKKIEKVKKIEQKKELKKQKKIDKQKEKIAKHKALEKEKKFVEKLIKGNKSIKDLEILLKRKTALEKQINVYIKKEDNKQKKFNAAISKDSITQLNKTNKLRKKFDTNKQKLTELAKEKKSVESQITESSNTPKLKSLVKRKKALKKSIKAYTKKKDTLTKLMDKEINNNKQLIISYQKRISKLQKNQFENNNNKIEKLHEANSKFKTNIKNLTPNSEPAVEQFVAIPKQTLENQIVEDKTKKEISNELEQESISDSNKLTTSTKKKISELDMTTINNLTTKPELDSKSLAANSMLKNLQENKIQQPKQIKNKTNQKPQQRKNKKTTRSR